jgi:proteasome accessory factor B
VYAYEPASSQAKTFLLRRIVSSVSFSNVEVTPAPDRVTEEAVGALQDVYSRQRADLTITPHSEAWSVLAARPDSSVKGTQVMVHYTDLAIFADEITSYGHDVVVNGPPDLRERVTCNLAELVGRHGR